MPVSISLPLSPKIAVLNLPNVPLEKIIKMMVPADVLSFSLASTRATNAVKESRITSDEHIQVKFLRNKVFIFFQDEYGTQTDQKCFLQYESDDNVKYSGSLMYSPKYEWKTSQKLSISRVCGMKSSVEQFFSVKYSVKDMEKAVKCAIKHICSIFRRPVTRVSVDVDDVPEFNELNIWEYLEYRCDEVRLTGRSMQHAELLKFLQTVQVVKGLKIDVETIENQPAELPDRFPDLRGLDFLSMSAPWINENHLCELRCQFIEVRDTQISGEGINKWLKQWLASDEKIVQVLMVTTKNYYNLAEIVRDLPKEQFRSSKPQECRKIGSLVCRTDRLPFAMVNYRVTRQDGAVATVYGDLTISINYSPQNVQRPSFYIPF